MLDLQLPQPLLHPAAWQTQSHELLFSLAHLPMGGPVESLWRRAETQAKHLYIAAPANFWAESVAKEPSLAVLVQSRFETVSTPVTLISHVSLNHFEQAAWKDLWSKGSHASTLNFERDTSIREISLADWSREVFPDSFRDAGEIVWRREFQNYEKELGPTFISIDQLRFWPGFLKLKGFAFAAPAAAEWAFAQALFSPQDDHQSEGPIAILNPTLQIFETEATLIAVWRTDGKIKKRPLEWDEAAVIDELRESPQIEIVTLKSELKAKAYPFKSQVDFETTLTRLQADGFILRRA